MCVLASVFVPAAPRPADASRSAARARTARSLIPTVNARQAQSQCARSTRHLRSACQISKLRRIVPKKTWLKSSRLEKERKKQADEEKRAAEKREKAEAKVADRCERARRDLARAIRRATRWTRARRPIEQMQKATQEVSKREASCQSLSEVAGGAKSAAAFLSRCKRRTDRSRLITIASSRGLRQPPTAPRRH